MTYPDSWTCPICKTFVRQEERCTNCTYPALWHCPSCKHRMNSTLFCKECGYNPMNPAKSKKIIKRNQILTIVVVVYGLILAFFVFKIVTQDKASTVGELMINSNLSLVFYTFQNIDSATFIITSPTGSLQSFQATKQDNNWIVSNITLNEAGAWQLNVDKYNNNEKQTFFYSFKINGVCVRDEQCTSYGEDYACNVALDQCVQAEPDVLDFLKVIGLG